MGHRRLLTRLERNRPIRIKEDGNEQCVAKVLGTPISYGMLKCEINAQISCEGKRTSSRTKTDDSMP
jgi:hypothetical protein